MKLNKQHLGRIIAIALFVAVLAGSWDAWWHSAIGRDSFWEPPHLLLYSSVLASIIAGLYGWIKTKEKVWALLAIILFIIPLSAPFDELWHRFFGMENLMTPFVLWSPPHLLLIFSLAAAFLLLLPILSKEKNMPTKRLFMAMSIAGILALLLLVTGPLDPTGPWAVAGFWGPGIMAAVFAGIIILAQKRIPGIAPATLVILFLIAVIAIGFSEQIAPGVQISPHDHPPPFLTVFSFLAAAVAIDILHNKPSWIRGGIAGLVWIGLLYGFSSVFFAPEFKYSLSNTFIAVTSGLIGGLLVGISIYLIEQNKKNKSRK